VPNRRPLSRTRPWQSPSFIRKLINGRSDGHCARVGIFSRTRYEFRFRIGGLQWAIISWPMRRLSVRTIAFRDDEAPPPHVATRSPQGIYRRSICHLRIVIIIATIIARICFPRVFLAGYNIRAHSSFFLRIVIKRDARATIHYCRRFKVEFGLLRTGVNRIDDARRDNNKSLFDHCARDPRAFVFRRRQRRWRTSTSRAPTSSCTYE